jgi:glycosyltransferase involved in cell wall biosynthesis
MRLLRTIRPVPPAPAAGNHFAERLSVPVTQQTPIAVVMTSFDAGGTERQMLELVRRLDRERWQVHLACLHARGHWHAKAAAAAPITAFPITGFGRPETCRQALSFARWCTRHGIEVVHTTDLYTNIFALPAAAFARVPVRIGSRRGLNLDRTAGQLRMQRAAYSCAHGIVANSHAIADRLVTEHVRRDKVTVIPNGLDLETFTPAPARDRRRRVIVVANLRPEKGYDVLIDAAALVLRRYPDARFECVGTGPEFSAIHARLAAHDVAHAFTLLGQRDDVPTLLTTADIFVLPSRTESLPNSVLEAMAAGLPVVASAVGGIPELIDDERTGLLWPSGNADALAERLCRVMADPSVGTRLGEAARRETQARYSFERMVAAFDSLYVRELAKRGRARTEMAA